MANRREAFQRVIGIIDGRWTPAGRMMVQMLGVFAEFESYADIGIALILWSAIRGVLDVALLPETPRRRHVLWSVLDVAPAPGSAPPALCLVHDQDGQGL